MCIMNLNWPKTLSDVPMTGTIYKGFTTGIAVCMLSFSTNLLRDIARGLEGVMRILILPPVSDSNPLYPSRCLGTHRNVCTDISLADPYLTS